jgi:hypothetical protein
LRAKGLIAGLALLLALLVFAFWRAVSAPRSSGENGAATAEGRSDGPAIAAPVPSLAARPPAAPSPTAAPPRAAAAAPPAASAPAPLDEPHLMERLRSIKDGDPAAAVELARAGNRRFPESPDAPERTSILIHALVATDRASEARGQAEDMVNRYAPSSFTREVEQFTGAHPHRDIRVTDAGTVEYK